MFGRGCGVGRGPRDRWVFPAVAAESNNMVPVVRRAELGRCEAIRLCGQAAATHLGTPLSECAHIDLYSCFPSAVRMQRDELGIPPDTALTVTGGMSFAGGPFNNYVLQSTAKMASILRSEPASRGLITTASGC